MSARPTGAGREIDQATDLLMGAFALDAPTASAVLAWLARRTEVTTAVVAGRFLDAAHDDRAPADLTRRAPRATWPRSG